ncbi:hypothetical protein ACF0H5_011135 [Mactra antiquata]
MNAIYFYLEDKDSGTGVRFYTPPNGAGNVTLDDVCTYTDIRSDGEYELLVKKDQINNAVIDCPSNLQTTFDVIMATNTISDCNGTQLISNGGVFVYNYSSCVTGVFNNGGIVQCLYSRSNTYITLYNNDTLTDGSTTFRFTCFAYRKTAADVEATEYPSACQTEQSPTSVQSPGITYLMTDRLYSPSVDKKDNTTTIIIIVFCVLAAVIIIGIIIIVLYLKVFRKPRPPTPPKIRKRRRKPSVTEYTPRVLGRASSIEKIDEKPSKVSTGEIISGIHVDKRHSNMNLDSASAYQPPKKEVWQKKWEKDLHPKTQTPRLSKDVLKNSKVAFPSLDSISKDKDTSVFELDKAFTMSTSLPESLDHYSTFSSSRQGSRGMKGVEGFSSETINTDITDLPKYSERSHATSKIPESTGKFGGPSTMPSFESVLMPAMDSRLDTITENPLSRENTSMSLSQKDNRLKKLQQNLLRMRNGDVTARSTPVTASDGTASVGDIRLHSFQSISRFSHLSASNASIFDDPGWLHENSKPSETAFERLKNLLPTFVRSREKDSKSFLQAPKVSAISREDLDYFLSRNKTTVGVHLLSQKSTSKEIIARAKTKRNKQDNKPGKPKFVQPTTPHINDEVKQNGTSGTYLK